MPRWGVRESHLVGIEIVFETHSPTEDNERGIATGWLPAKLSAQGRVLARELGERRGQGGFAAVVTSDLRQAKQTASIAFATNTLHLFADQRLRECNFGELNGQPVAEVHASRRAHLDVAYPGGESWREAVDRVADALDDFARRWEGKRILIIGHVATRWALDRATGTPLEDLVDADFAWQEGWEYHLP